jgi:hypothetical protein
VDVAISLYDDSAVNAGDFVATHRCPGGKFGGLAAFFAENPGVIDDYTHFWLLDDDLYVPFDSVPAMRAVLDRDGFPLCGPGLAPESFATWPITIQNGAFQWRATNFVEIMAPVMSREFLRRALPLFGENHSGWGYEWVWQVMLGEMGACSAIVDSAPVVHTRPVGSGNLYTAAGRISPHDEMDALLAKHGIDRHAVPFRNLFGMTRADGRLVLGAEFSSVALGGYAPMRDRHPETYETCRTFLAEAPPAIDSPAEARRLMRAWASPPDAA